MIKSKITAIGPQAIDEKQPLLILFGETASERLREVSLIHGFENDPIGGYDIKKGSKVRIGSSEYEVEFVGQLVESNLTSIGHTVLAFKEVPETPQENAIYLKPHAIPKIEIGTEIVFD
ncbi:MAG: PTS glucose transporter subunit IIA [Lactobacillus ruminis]|nr:PTS glucose transporter subunit IIA [Ligilactobacillus ruminis]